MLKNYFFSLKNFNVSLFFIGILFLLPFVCMSHQLPIVSFYPEWIAATLGLVAAFPLFRIVSWQSIQIPQISLVFLGLGTILLIQWAQGMLLSTQYALLILSYFCWAFFLVILGGHLRQELGWEKLTSALSWCLVIAGIINVGIVVLQFVTRTGGVISFLPNLASYGALSQPNHFANFTVLATASLIYLHAKGRFSLSFFVLILTCFLMMLSFSGSRSAWLYLTSLTILAVFLQISSKKQGETPISTYSIFRVGLLLLPTFVIVQLFIYYVIPNELVNLPTERLVDSANVNTTSARLHIWYDSLRLFIQSPWLGLGAGAMRAESFKLLDSPMASSFNQVFEHAHNLLLHLLAEMGISAFLIICVGIFAWIHAFKWRDISPEKWWLLSLLSVLCIHSMLEYPLWFAYFLGITAVLLGAGDEKYISFNFQKLNRKLLGTCQIVGQGILVVILLLGIANLSTLWLANNKLENWVERFMYEGTDEKKLLDWVNQHSLLSPYADLLTVISMPLDTDNIDKKVKLSQSVMRFKSSNIVVYRHALLLEIQGDHESAIKQLNRALIAYPRQSKDIIEYIPSEYKQKYLDLLYEVRPVITENTR